MSSLTASRPLIVADAFCGAGGSSEGMRNAFAARDITALLVAIRTSYKLAQGFPASYKFSGTKEQQTKMIGNVVSVRVAAALWDSALDVLVPLSARQSTRSDVA